MGTLRLRIGFPETTAVPDAISQAIADWRETCQRADLTPVGDLSVELDTQDPERSALGEYVVNVTGDTDGHV